MTDKSDAQLDAEAAEPLGELIYKHRVYYHRDLYKPKLSTDDPPVLFDEDGDPEVQVTEIGMPLSWPLTSHLFSETVIVDGTEQPVRSIHGPDSLWSKAAFAQWAKCRRIHPEHAERESFRGSLCRLVVGAVIRQHRSVDDVASDLQLEATRLASTLRSALRDIDREMKRLLEKAEFRHREDLGRFSWDETIPVHHAVPGLHMQDCPQCRRSNAA